MKRPVEQRRSFTEEEFIADVAVAGFMGAWEFWQSVKLVARKTGEPVETVAEGLLRAMACSAAARYRPNGPVTPQEREAFHGCGLKFCVPEDN